MILVEAAFANFKSENHTRFHKVASVLSNPKFASAQTRDAPAKVAPEAIPMKLSSFCVNSRLQRQCPRRAWPCYPSWNLIRTTSDPISTKNTSEE